MLSPSHSLSLSLAVALPCAGLSLLALSSVCQW